MNLLYWVTSSVCLLLCLIVCSCRAILVTGFYGQDVTLPCKYDSKYHGKCEICWLKGDIPVSGCGAEILATNGDKVDRRTSSRYTLKGDIQKGDVSLTIVSTTTDDSGKYGCRVHVPGWFNDKKYVVNLQLVEAPAPKPTTPVNSLLSRITEISSEEPWLSVSTREVPKPVNSANFSNTSLPVHNKNVIDSTYDMLPGIVVSALLLLLLGPLAVYFMWKQKRKSRGTLETAHLHPSVIYGNVNSTVGILNREMAVENVYQLDTENEYERWS
ncbi:hepatitis A virus cellular receptor 1 [Pygocentrus nattereri]|uniref:Ig-like domain-containing protein n=1 Tax=Pygocentrus nattereri TaxID=42514 RepID=A0A3B4DXC0_PYGNA|nr:hepatitis A virus cellular receptor 1 [Pygocentrus nattereri]